MACPDAGTAPKARPEEMPIAIISPPVLHVGWSVEGVGRIVVELELLPAVAIKIEHSESEAWQCYRRARDAVLELKLQIDLRAAPNYDLAHAPMTAAVAHISVIAATRGKKV